MFEIGKREGWAEKCLGVQVVRANAWVCSAMQGRRSLFGVSEGVCFKMVTSLYFALPLEFLESFGNLRIGREIMLSWHHGPSRLIVSLFISWVGFEGKGKHGKYHLQFTYILRRTSNY